MIFRNVTIEAFEEALKLVSARLYRCLLNRFHIISLYYRNGSLLFAQFENYMLETFANQVYDINESLTLLFQPEDRVILNKLATKYPTEMDATLLLKVLKNHWKGKTDSDFQSALATSHRRSCCSVPVILAEKPSLELCKSLIMLRDYNISGKINLIDVPALMHTLHFWRVQPNHILLTTDYNYAINPM